MDFNLNCVVSHGVGWNGGVREYHGVVSVDLDKNEVFDIQKVLSQCKDDGFDEAKEEKKRSEPQKKVKQSLATKNISII